MDGWTDGWDGASGLMRGTHGSSPASFELRVSVQQQRGARLPSGCWEGLNEGTEASMVSVTMGDGMKPHFTTQGQRQKAAVRTLRRPKASL